MNKKIKQNQIKSKDRVKDHGEVFTAEREVNAMLDLVEDEANRVDSRFLEPACGTGNFLVAILDRKLKTVMSKHNTNQDDFEKHVFVAVGSIYAIDIQEDNCIESRERLYTIVDDLYRNSYSESINDKFLLSIKYILDKNVILGNGLTGLQMKDDKPITFSEWNFKDKVLERKDFTMNGIIKHNKKIDDQKKIVEESESLGGFMAMLVQDQEPETLLPIYEKTYSNLTEVIELE